ncbi:hypothetical protein chiPu_0018260 [Chiloscyllium punctatum]|uniref:Uncharacterized protein n=1 Tax=Chiloscyllium punctatum TaxID=137246 RepID=A0A401RM68_CHIPU|nr:hypothetical protein [Chiloscyllium punctatum]
MSSCSKHSFGVPCAAYFKRLKVEPFGIEEPPDWITEYEPELERSRSQGAPETEKSAQRARRSRRDGTLSVTRSRAGTGADPQLELTLKPDRRSLLIPV